MSTCTGQNVQGCCARAALPWRDILVALKVTVLQGSETLPSSTLVHCRHPNPSTYRLLYSQVRAGLVFCSNNTYFHNFIFTMFPLHTIAATSLILPAILAAPTYNTAQKPVKSWNDDTPLPLVIWHGLGDNYAADGLNSVVDLAAETVPGLFTYIVRLNEDPKEDSKATFFGNLTEQVDTVCKELAEHPKLSTAPAIDAIGFSQGGQFMRAYVERCNNPPVRNLLTFGSQHNGIIAYQTCGPFDYLCKAAGLLLRSGTWTEYVQSHLVPAQYYRDPLEMENYLEHSNFLADINNERRLKNQTYKENLEKLENFVMYVFSEDTTVIPKESSWFGELNATESIPLRNMTIYEEDWLGLKKLDLEGKLTFKTLEGRHMEFSDEALIDTFSTYLGREGKKFDHSKPDAYEEL